MAKINFQNSKIIFIHVFIPWILCGATLGIGQALLTRKTTFIIFAILAPIFFALSSFIYHKKYNFTSPIVTAFIFSGFVALMDLVFVAPVIEKSYDMFKNFLESWLPFILILFATYFSGIISRNRA